MLVWMGAVDRGACQKIDRCQSARTPATRVVSTATLHATEIHYAVLNEIDLYIVNCCQLLRGKLTSQRHSTTKTCHLKLIFVTR